jgi:hypothetical protein
VQPQQTTILWHSTVASTTLPEERPVSDQLTSWLSFGRVAILPVCRSLFPFPRHPAAKNNHNGAQVGDREKKKKKKPSTFDRSRTTPVLELNSGNTLES